MANDRKKKLDANIAKGQDQIDDLIKRYKQTISGIVLEQSSRRNFSTAASTRNALYKMLAKEYRKFGSDIDQWTVNNINKTASDFWRFAKVDMPVKGTFGAFSSKHIMDIVGEINPTSVNNLVAVNAQASIMFQSHVRRLRAAVSTTLAEGAIEGLTRTQMASRMKEKVLSEGKTFEFVDRGGRKWNSDTYFSMLSQTIHSQAARKTYALAGSEAGIDLYVIAGGITGSSKKYPNDPCDDWAGKAFSLTGNTPGYPTYQEVLDAGVFHPNCRHFMRAALKSEIDEELENRNKQRTAAGL